MSKYWSDIVGTLQPYVPGEQPADASGLVKLNTNENPYGPSPRALAAMREALGDGLRLYPDPSATRLREAIAGRHQLRVDQVFVGNGSDEVLAHVFNGLLRHDEPLLMPAISYSFYPVYCGLFGIRYRQLPLDGAMCIDVGDYCAPNGGVVLANPNAPTGRLLDLGQIARLVESNSERVVVVDEAYIDFGGASAVSLIDQFDNLLVVQTFSKSRSLAGLRVGFAMGHAALIEALDRVKNSFNSYPLSALAQAGAVAALEDEEYFQRRRGQVIRAREEMTAALQALDFDVLPSAANFVFATHRTVSAADLLRQLRSQGVMVRHFAQAGIDNYLRISVGTGAQQRSLFGALSRVLGT